MKRVLLALIAGCNAATTPSITVAPIASSTASHEAAPRADGLYFDADAKGSCAVQGSWLACVGAEAVALRVESSERSLRPLDGSPPYLIESPGTLRTPLGVTLSRRDDPFLARALDRLSGRVFVRLDDKSLPTADAITMETPLLAAIDMTDHDDRTCRRGVLFPDPTWNRSIALGPVPPPPKPGEVGVRTFLLFDVKQGCDRPVEPHTRIRGAFGGVRLFADANGEPLGLTLEGYMYGSAWVVRGASQEMIDRMRTAAARALEHQAE